MKIENVKGTFDYSGKEQQIREYIKDTLKDVFKLYGYEPLETPIICNFDLLALKYGQVNWQSNIDHLMMRLLEEHTKWRQSLA